MNYSHSMSSTPTNEIKNNIEKFITRNMPKIDSHGGAFAIYDIDLKSKYVRVKFAGSCTSCSHGQYKFNQLKKRIPKEFPSIDNVHIEFT